MFYTEKDVERFRSAKDEVIVELRSQVKFLHQELQRERQRAELAIDQILAERKIPSLMPERARIPPLETREEINKRKKELELLKSELESVGDLGGAPAEHGDQERIPT